MSSSEAWVRLKELAAKGLMVNHWHPEVGYESEPRPVAIIEKRDKFMVFDANDANRNVNVVKFSSIAEVDDKTIHVLLDRQFPQAVVVFRRPVTPEETSMTEMWVDSIEDDPGPLKSKVEQALLMAEDITREMPATERHKFMRWTEWVPGSGERAAGVALAQDDRVEFFPFRGFAETADYWSRQFRDWNGKPEDIYDAVRERMGASASLSEPESIMAASYDDAVERALYEFARDIFAESGLEVMA